MRPVQVARTSKAEPPAPIEIDASARVRHAKCGPLPGLLFPGVSQLCLGQKARGLGLMMLGAVELGGGIAAGVALDDDRRNGFEHPGSFVPLLAFQDTYVYSVADGFIQRSLAASANYAPRDSLTDLAAAPFNWEVMKRPRVWAGLAATLALGIGASFLITGTDFGDERRPNVFGKHMAPGIGYPLAGATGVALFTHVAVAEEALFRGHLQSAFARNGSETGAWAMASAIFGLVHAPNALALDGGERTDYLLYALPVITAVGAYFGWAYKEEGYSMAPPVALHFWYDFLLSATFFALDPDDSPISASLRIPF